MSTKISMKDLEPELQESIQASGEGTVTQINQKKPDADGIVTITPKDIEAVSEYGGKLGGDYFFEGDQERVLGFKGDDGMLHGFFFKPAGMGIYDWVNGRNVFNYDGEENVINITTGSLDINGVPTSVEGHTHAISDVSDLQTALNNAYNMAKEFGIGGTVKKLPVGYDIQTLNTTGLFGGSELLNTPDNTFYYIFNLVYDDQFSKQFVYGINNTNKGKTLEKNKYAGVWETQWTDKSGGGSSGAVDGYVHVGDFTVGGPNYGYSRFNVADYKQVRFFIDGIQKNTYAADTATYNLELELWNPFGTTNTHAQRNIVGTVSGATADRLRLLNVPADSTNYLPAKIYGEVEINLEDPIMYTKSRMYYLNTSITTGVSDDTSGRAPMAYATIEGNRTFHRSSIPQWVTFRYNHSVGMGRIRMYGIPR